jgi:hypothetical protein
MQYLLTDQEYTTLLTLKKEDQSKELMQIAIKTFRKVISDTIYPCIHDYDPVGNNNFYCDDCPIGSLQLDIDRSISKIMCPLSKQYSK